VSPSHGLLHRLAWPPSASLLRYGLAILSVGLAGLLMYGLQMISIQNGGPVLLVAVAISALYGGLAPGLIALALSTLVYYDPVVLVAGAALAVVCGRFRPAGSRHAPGPQVAAGEDTVPDLSNEPLNRLDVVAPKFSREVAAALQPSFREVTTEATWRFHHEQPLDITLPEDEQVEHLYLYSVLAECNDAFARMYGFRSAADVIGTRLVVFLPPSNPENIAYLRTFIRSGYRLEDAESREIDRYGNAKCFVNNLVGIFERGQLVGAWGTQRDITDARLPAAHQETRSRIHSSKSSSQ
jgi:hypothetical protein